MDLTKPPTPAELEELFTLFQNRVDAFLSLGDLCYFSNATTAALVEEFSNIKQKTIWRTLEDCYQFAFFGREPKESDCNESCVISAGEVVEALMPDCEPWQIVVAAGNARCALDGGFSVQAGVLPYLARVDIRTVKNAISAKELLVNDSLGSKPVYVTNSSARRWLRHRRHFHPAWDHRAAESLEKVSSSEDLAEFLQKRRADLELTFDKSLMPRHPAVTQQSLEALEDGIFTMPLDVVPQLAEYYHVDEKLLLDVVLHCFCAELLNDIFDVLQKENQEDERHMANGDIVVTANDLQKLAMPLRRGDGQTER